MAVPWAQVALGAGLVIGPDQTADGHERLAAEALPLPGHQGAQGNGTVGPVDGQPLQGVMQLPEPNQFMAKCPQVGVSGE